MTEQELNTRGSKRNIGEELIKSLKELSAGIYGRKTTFEFQPNGDVRRVVARADGSVEKDEMLHGSRWKILAARTTSGLSQSAFASALGISKRTLENWEQGRVEPSGAARQLLALAVRYPDTLEKLRSLAS
jgi:putative transcriptional regulator